MPKSQPHDDLHPLSADVHLGSPPVLICPRLKSSRDIEIGTPPKIKRRYIII
jgi:hypothetical protein